MNNIKNTFSIKDLENLSGIKAHTIRIWERRYKLLEPNRTETNIRYYNLSNLQKLLNITFLNNNGYKISKISKIKDSKIPSIVREVTAENSIENRAVNSFKLAMLNFDQALFFETYKNLLKEKSFRDIFYEVFIPLLEEIGLLWQTDTISPSHEHFISALIKQKILINIENIQYKIPTNTSKTFVLFLPENEIHELGLMYLNYEILTHGYQSIFLGQSIPMENLSNLLQFYNNIVFVSYFTIKPDVDLIKDYMNDFDNKLLKNSNSKLWVLGKRTNAINTSEIPKNIEVFSDIKSFIKTL